MDIGSGLNMYNVVVKRWHSLSHLLMRSCYHDRHHHNWSCIVEFWRKQNSFFSVLMGGKLSCLKGSRRSRASRNNESSSAAASGQNHQHLSSTAVSAASSGRIVVNQNGRQIIRTVRTLQNGDSIVIAYPRTDVRTLILDMLRSLRSLIAK